MECDTGLLMELCYERGRRIEELTEETQEIRDEVASVLQLMDGLAEQWGDEGVFRRCRDRLRALVGDTAVPDDRQGE